MEKFALAVFAAVLSLPLSHAAGGITIHNTHVIYDAQGTVIRGAAPGKKIHQLVKAGVTDVLIFKNELKTEVGDEIEALAEEGISGKHVLSIPFRWKKLESFKKACQQTIQALQFLDSVAHKKGKSAYFHCTVGEDRTGMLAGLFRMLEEGWSVQKAFEQELCPNGYEAGNPAKPKKVVQAIREELTPVFLKMAFLVENGSLTHDELEASVCNRDPGDLEAFTDDERYAAENYRCGGK